MAAGPGGVLGWVGDGGEGDTRQCVECLPIACGARIACTPLPPPASCSGRFVLLWARPCQSFQSFLCFYPSTRSGSSSSSSSLSLKRPLMITLSEALPAFSNALFFSLSFHCIVGRPLFSQSSLSHLPLLVTAELSHFSTIHGTAGGSVSLAIHAGGCVAGGAAWVERGYHEPCGQRAVGRGFPDA